MAPRTPAGAGASRTMLKHVVEGTLLLFLYACASAAVAISSLREGGKGKGESAWRAVAVYGMLAGTTLATATALRRIVRRRRAAAVPAMPPPAADVVVEGGALLALEEEAERGERR